MRASKIIDFIGITLIGLGIAMTAMIFISMRQRPISDVESITIQELAPPVVGSHI